jgi:hypothetical protein
MLAVTAPWWYSELDAVEHEEITEVSQLAFASKECYHLLGEH